MDIINVITVAKKAEVEHWIESNDDDLLNVFYWRQAFDCRTLQLSVRLAAPSGAEKPSPLSGQQS